MKYVNQAVPKVDAKALVTGKGVYVNDRKGCSKPLCTCIN